MKETYHGGTETRRRANLHRIVMTLKSSGADSSGLTQAVTEVSAAMMFGSRNGMQVVLA